MEVKSTACRSQVAVTFCAAYSDRADINDAMFTRVRYFPTANGDLCIIMLNHTALQRVSWCCDE